MIAKMTQSLADLYLADETAWLDATAELIKAGRFDELDFELIAEFLVDNANRDRHDVYCRLLEFLSGLLVWKHHYDKLTSGRRSEILGQQFELENWTDTPTLLGHADKILPRTCRDAVEVACAEASAPPSTFPAECPWILAQLLSEEVLQHGD
jgi:hypothetical protein